MVRPPVSEGAAGLLMGSLLLLTFVLLGVIFAWRNR
jgi:hypothetical protein